jgi:hypothetical protein
MCKTQDESRIAAMRAFVLSDRMKRGPFDNVELFAIVLSAEKQRVQALSEVDLRSIIDRDHERLENYCSAAWRFEVVELANCSVYPQMGERAWATGNVPEVVEKFERLEPLTSRIWSMKCYVEFFKSSDWLPILILQRGSELKIDDGSHRAVALRLSNIQKTGAWIGTLQSDK